MKKFSNNANLNYNLISAAKFLKIYSKVVILDEIYKSPHNVRHYRMKSRKLLSNKTVARQLKYLVENHLICKYKNTYYIKEEQKTNIHSLFTALIRIGMTRNNAIPNYDQYST